MKKSLLIVALLFAFVTSTYAQNKLTWKQNGMKCTIYLLTGDFSITLYDKSNNEYTIHGPEYDFDVNATSGSMSYYNGRVTSVGGISISYYNGRVSSIGGTSISYYNNRVSSVGRTSISYYNGKVSSIGGTSISYYNNRVSSVGKATISYYNGKVSSISGSVN